MIVYDQLSLAGILVCLLLFAGVLWRSGKSLCTRILLVAVLILPPVLMFCYGLFISRISNLEAERSIPMILQRCLGEENLTDGEISAALREEPRQAFTLLWNLSVSAKKR